MKGVEKTMEEMKKKYKQMEDELELRRQEVFQMKRESSTQYVMEERENWKAMIAQQQQVISKLEKGGSFVNRWMCRSGDQSGTRSVSAATVGDARGEGRKEEEGVGVFPWCSGGEFDA